MTDRESKPVRTPGKGTYQAPISSTDGLAGDRDSTSIRDRMNAMAADPWLIARAQAEVAAAVLGQQLNPTTIEHGKGAI